MLKVDGDEVCALYEMEPERRALGIPGHWLSHVSVESADATAARAEELGGETFGGTFDVEDAGRMAHVQDPPPVRCSRPGSRGRTSARGGSTTSAA